MTKKIIDAILAQDHTYLENHRSDLEFLVENHYSHFLYHFQTECRNQTTREIVKILLPYCQEQDIIDLCLVRSTRFNSIDVIDALLTKASKSASNAALSAAASADRLDIVQHLLPLCPSRHENSNALIAAILANNYEVACALLPHADAQLGQSWPLVLAASNGNKKMCDLLYPVSNAKDALSEALKLGFQADETEILRDYIRIETDHAALLQSVEGQKNSPTSRPKM